MRVSTAGQTQAIIARLLDSQSKLAEAQQRATSGIKVGRMSDDPTAASAIVHDSTALRGIEQYARNAQSVSVSLDAEDSALQQVNDLLNRAKEVGVEVNTATATPAARTAAAAELQQLVKQAVAVANTKIGSQYVFGGTNNNGRPPFDASSSTFVPSDPAPAGSAAGAAPVPRYPTGVRAIDVGAGGQTLDGPHDGTSVFLGYTAGAPDATRGVLPALQQLAAAVGGSDPSQIGAALTAIDDAVSQTSVRVGELGARQNQTDLVSTGLTALQTSLAQHKSSLREVDAEQAITEMLARQTAYQAAMLASSKVIGLSLTDYLR